MGAPRAKESVLLSEAFAFLDRQSRHFGEHQRSETRYQILEAAASRIGGFDLEWYWETTQNRSIEVSKSEQAANELLELLRRCTSIHPSLALASLARPDLEFGRRRKTGAYYTDFRLASFLGEKIALDKKFSRLVLDPAAGTGALLAAVAVSASGLNKVKLTKIVGDCLCAADLTANALRGAALVLASLTSDKSAISNLLHRLRVGDSLIGGPTYWADLAPTGVDAIVTNPPWEKLKISRHEFLSFNGHDRHYGADYDQNFDTENYEKAKDDVSSYLEKIAVHYSLGKGYERDAYSLFLELCLGMLKGTGQLVAIIPAGLIRSKANFKIRKHLIESAKKISINLFDNKSRFFEIDTRFKFLIINAELNGSNKRTPIKLSFPNVDGNSIKDGQYTHIPRQQLHKLRPDLTLPEVKSGQEWRLFRRLSELGDQFGNTQTIWNHTYCREIDMSKMRPLFVDRANKQVLPLIEGRMVHQFSHAAKSYISGTGRRAVWKPATIGSNARPQFYFPKSHIPVSVSSRISEHRVGFCDITGQTNERTMLAAFIPANSVCGNKVPTILFNQDNEKMDIAFCWLAIANSFVFDWLLRRVVTTTVNYFILDSIPMPQIDPFSLPGRRLTDLARNISKRNTPIYRDWEIGERRAEIDTRILEAYRCSIADAELILDDFPLLDRSEPPIQGEEFSTITRDYILLKYREFKREQPSSTVSDLRDRVRAAKLAGAIPYRGSALHSKQKGLKNRADVI